ncbi:MAG: sensor histidine kinase [Aquabacterium sp.]|jgi:signal transduction histidine kinase|nr:MAG: sensor histidine kinase [Aquabacterium sp.]TAL24286.1 MAG: sensor histidine kinase [Aquabacterium sp.]
MLKSLSSKLAVLVTAAFMVICSVLLLLTQAMLDPEHVLQLSGFVVSGSVAFAMLAALAVFQLFTRRIKALADAVTSYRQGDFRTPLKLPGADADGDEIERLAAHVEMMSGRIACQVGELDRAALRRRELLANVSHDLRTPLTSMQGYLEMLLIQHGRMDPAEQRSYLETATRHCERLARLVADLFELTKLDAGEVQPQLEEFPPAELAHDIAQKFSLDASRRAVRLVADCADPRLAVRADIGMVERVLENLVENALRHTPAGGEVRIELSGAGERARMRVRDSGAGIAAEDLPHVFDRYYRGDRTDRGEGTHLGLGLAICRKMVQLHGGELLVHSTPGSGTSFDFDLQLAGAAAAHP